MFVLAKVKGLSDGCCGVYKVVVCFLNNNTRISEGFGLYVLRVWDPCGGAVGFTV